jgi:hypothetical protein
VSTAKTQDNSVCFYAQEVYQDLIGCFEPELNRCIRLDRAAHSIVNDTRYNIALYQRSNHRGRFHPACRQEDAIEDVQPGQSREAFRTGVWAYKVYDAG